MPSAVLRVVEVLPRLGLPPSLVLMPGYSPNVTPMSYPPWVVAPLMLSAAGSKPLLTDEDDCSPSPAAIQVSPPPTFLALVRLSQLE